LSQGNARDGAVVLFVLKFADKLNMPILTLVVVADNYKCKNSHVPASSRERVLRPNVFAISGQITSMQSLLVYAHTWLDEEVANCQAIKRISIKAADYEAMSGTARDLACPPS